MLVARQLRLSGSQEALSIGGSQLLTLTNSNSLKRVSTKGFSMAEARLQAYRFNSKVAGVADLVNQSTIGDGTGRNMDGCLIPYQVGFMLTKPSDLLSVE